MVDALNYIGFISPDAAEWASFGPDILGAELADPGADGAVRLRLDDAVWRIAVHPGDHNDLAYLGWGVAGPAGLATAVDRLEDAGVPVREGSAELCTARAVTELVWFADPFGFRHEIGWGQTHRPASFRPGRAMSGFVTGVGGAGHAVLFVPDRIKAERFYCDALGLRLSDRIVMGGKTEVTFLHCNPRHHSLAFVAVPEMVGFHHLMLEVVSLDDVGAALDLCADRGIPIVMGLGRHTNDRMTSFYLRGPSGFEIEYGWGGALVDDDTWVPERYEATSIWGHRPAADGGPPPGIIRPAGLGAV